MSVDDFMQKKLNKVTEKALKQSKAGKNLKKFDSLNDLFDDLGISPFTDEMQQNNKKKRPCSELKCLA